MATLRVRFQPVGDADRYVSVGRVGQARRPRPVKTVRVRFGLKIVIYRDRTYGSDLWRIRCDLCRADYDSRAHQWSETHAEAVQRAVQHAANVHGVSL